MKLKTLIVAIALALVGITSFAALVSPTQLAVLNRRRAVSRERIEIGGTNFWVVTYQRGGVFDGCETNAERTITGVAQNNPLQVLLEKRTAVLARLRERCVEKAATYRELESKAVTTVMRKLYGDIAQAYEDEIDIIDGKAASK